MSAVYDDVLARLSTPQLAAVRRQNDRKYRGWSEGRVVALHDRTLRDTRYPDAYVAGVRLHLASGLYRRIYPPAFVEASRRWLAAVDSRRARAGFTEPAGG